MAMADAISPRRYHCVAGPVGPLPDKYALATDERTNDGTD